MDAQNSTNKKGYAPQTDREQEILKLEKQVAVGIWVQAVGQIIELVNLIKLRECTESHELIDEQKILSGVSLQTLGTIVEAIGVTEIVLPEGELSLIAQKIAVTGDWLQAVGSILEAAAGSEVIRKNEPIFIP